MSFGTHQRSKHKCHTTDLNVAVSEINNLLARGQYLEALDIIEQFCDSHPAAAIPLLVAAYDIFKQVPDQESRYYLYQARYFNYPVKAGDQVLDIGSGHIPFPFATHLADFAIEDHNYGRAGLPFKHVAGKPVFNCSVENMPFENKSFDFVYCSHVLEHVSDPIQACKELMRVAKRGYLETPTRAKDLFLHTAKISHHNWMVEYFNNRLIFTQYNSEQLNGLACDLLMSMHCSPETDREKAFSALVLLKSDQVNTMLMWEGGFDVEVRRIDKPIEYYNWQVAQTQIANNSELLKQTPINQDWSTASNSDPLAGAIRLSF